MGARQPQPVLRGIRPDFGARILPPAVPRHLRPAGAVRPLSRMADRALPRGRQAQLQGVAAQLRRGDPQDKTDRPSRKSRIHSPHSLRIRARKAHGIDSQPRPEPL